MRGLRRLTCLLAALLMLAGAQAEGAPMREAPYDEGTPLLELFVCPLLGADAMVLRQGEHAMMVDMGREKDLATICSVLDSLALTHFEYAFNTHPHTDHLGSMRALAGLYSFDRFVTGFDEDVFDVSVIQKPTIKALREIGMEIVRMGDGDTFSLGDAQLTVVQQTRLDGINEQSMMLLVTYGSFRLLLGADVTGQAQDLVAAAHDLHADVLKFPHHGLNKLTREFLNAVSPSCVLFTHGSLDTSAAQQQLDKAGIPYAFSTWGVLHLSSDGQTWRLEQPMDEENAAYAELFWSRKNAGQ